MVLTPDSSCVEVTTGTVVSKVLSPFAVASN
jgi:hypothetical protein